MERKPTEIETRVAMILCEATDCGQYSLTGRCLLASSQEPCAAMKKARAVIRAMREPTSDMIAAGEKATENYYSELIDFKDGWGFAIDAASPE